MPTGERPKASLSVALLLTHGRSNRLFLVRQSERSKAPGTRGLIAGGVELEDSTPLHAVFREALEETGIPKENIIFVRGRNNPRPHIAPVIGPDMIHLGLVYDMTYSGPQIPLTGWGVTGDDKIDRVDLYTWQQVLTLLEHPENIYRPEFNKAQLIRWLLLNHGANENRTRTVHDWLTQHKDSIDGLSDTGNTALRHDNMLTRWHYVPQYEQWMTLPDIYGRPERTNFARRRNKWRTE